MPGPDPKNGDKKGGRFRLGAVGWLMLLTLAFVGAWVVIGNAYDFAKPFWRYATIASISFTAGTFYGRYRRDRKQHPDRYA